MVERYKILKVLTDSNRSEYLWYLWLVAQSFLVRSLVITCLEEIHNRRNLQKRTVVEGYMYDVQTTCAPQHERENASCMGLNLFGSGVGIGAAEAFLTTSLTLTPMRQRKSRKGGKDDKASIAKPEPDRDKMTNKSQTHQKQQVCNGSASNNAASKHRDSGRAQPSKKPKPFPHQRREKREDEVEESKNKHRGLRENSQSQTGAKASQDGDEAIVDVPMCSDANSENRVPRQSPVAELTSGSRHSIDSYPHPSYLRPDILDLLNERARSCPPQPDPWGVRNKKFETFSRHLIPSERAMGELGACIYVNVLTNGLSEAFLENSKKISWRQAALDLATSNNTTELINNNVIRKGLQAPASAFIPRTGAIGADRPVPAPNRPLPHPNEVEHVVKSAKDLYKEQVGANDELAEIFLRRSRPSSANSTRNENIAPNFKKSSSLSESLHYQQYIPKMTSTNGIGSVTVSPRQTRDERMYTAASQAAAMAASVAVVNAAGLPMVGGPSAHQQQQQIAAAVHQYQYNPLHAPLNSASAFDLRRMFAAQADTQKSGEAFPLFRR